MSAINDMYQMTRKGGMRGDTDVNEEDSDGMVVG